MSFYCWKQCPDCSFSLEVVQPFIALKSVWIASVVEEEPLGINIANKEGGRKGGRIGKKKQGKNRKGTWE